MNRDLACHLIHSQYQLNIAENQEKLANAKVVIVGAGWPDYSSVKSKAPNAKILPSFNLHMIYNKGQSPLMLEFVEKLKKYVLKDENGNYVNNIDYPNANWEFYFSKELAKAHAKAIWMMIKDNPQVDGVYIDDCWGSVPPRYEGAYSSYYGEDVNWYRNDFKEYREAFLRSLKYWMPNDKIIICNTAGALAKGCSGISIEQNYPNIEAIQSFEEEKGFWNICWPRVNMITMENNHTRVLEGVFLSN